jgi:hypothetical protein
MSGEVIECVKCEGSSGAVNCSCDEFYCSNCIEPHLQRRPNHHRVNARSAGIWSWVSGMVGGLHADEASTRNNFIADEGAKWFGLYVEKNAYQRISSIVETPRFRKLAEKSSFANGVVQRQFPSLVSFVGETGAGKSTLSM